MDKTMHGKLIYIVLILKLLSKRMRERVYKTLVTSEIYIPRAHSLRLSHIYYLSILTNYQFKHTGINERLILFQILKSFF